MQVKINKSMIYALLALSALPIAFVNCAKNGIALSDQSTQKVNIATTPGANLRDEGAPTHVDPNINGDDTDVVSVGNNQNEDSGETLVTQNFKSCEEIEAAANHLSQVATCHMQNRAGQFVVANISGLMINNVNDHSDSSNGILLIPHVGHLKIANVGGLTCAKADFVSMVKNYRGKLHIKGNVDQIDNFRGHLIVEGHINKLNNFIGKLEVTGQIKRKTQVIETE